MARIDPVIARPDLSGQVEGRRASAEDFHVDNSGFISGVDSIAKTLDDQQDQKEKLWAANMSSAKNLQYYQEFQNRMTDPDFDKKYGGDGGSFSPQFADYMNKDLEATLKDAPSERARGYVEQRMVGVRENMMQHSLTLQAQVGGAYVKDQFEQSLQNDAKLASISPADAAGILERGKQTIDELPYLSPEERMKLHKDYEQNVAFAAGKGTVSNGPGAQSFLDSLPGHDLGAFDPTHHAFGNSTTPVTAFGSVAQTKGAVTDYKATTLEQAAIHNVDPNFMLAQQMAESGGNVNARSPAGAVGLTQFMPATAARYGIDPTKPDQAIQGQAAYMGDLLKMFNGDYKKAAAAYNWGEGNVQNAIAKHGDQWMAYAPKETQDYVVNIFSNAQPAPSASATGEAITTMQNSEPVRSGTAPEWFNKLDWKQQYEIVADAKQSIRADAAAESQRIELAKKQKDAHDQQIMNGFFDKMMDNQLSVQEVRNSDLDYDKKEHLMNALNKSESRTDPQVFNDLFNRIHATDDNSTYGPVARITTDDQLLPYVGHGISYEDLSKLRTELHGKNTVEGQTLGELKKNFFAMAKGQIDNSTWIQKDPIGKQKFYAFQQAALSEISRRQAKGENVLEAFDPNSPNYIGKMIPTFVRTPQQQMTDYAKMMASNTTTPNAVEPRRDGETPAQYLERTSKK